MRRLTILLFCLAALCISVHGYAANVAVFSGQPTFATAMSDRLTALGHNAITWSDPYLATPENLAGADALMVLTGGAFLLEYQRDAIVDFVAGGGALIVEQPNVPGLVAIMPTGLEIDEYSRVFSDMNVTFTPAGQDHPMTAGLSTADLSGNMDMVYAADISPAYTILAVGATDPSLVALAVANYGSGKVVFETGNMLPMSVRPGSDAFLGRMIDWATARSGPSELTVDVMVSPGKINLRSRGYVHVAVLSSPDFDALTVDPATVLVAGAVPERWVAQDVNLDGLVDAVFFFRVQSLNVSAVNTGLELTGCTTDGLDIRGSSEVAVTAAKK